MAEKMTAVGGFPLSELVGHGSTETMADILDEIRPSFEAGEWRPSTSRYRSIGVHVNRSKTPNAEKVSTYIAASILLHLTDGWTFLSRAFEAPGTRRSSRRDPPRLLRRIASELLYIGNIWDWLIQRTPRRH